MAYALIFLNILLTVYAQFVVKWQVLQAGGLPASPEQKMHFMVRLLLNPWIVTAYMAAFAASITWMLAMTKLQLSHAYPMTALTFVVVVIGSASLFGESITPLKMAGLLLIIVGIFIGSQG
jgi:multidrug transporter EmrE-like cation transporter